MALPASGQITLSDIQTEFGGTNPIGLSEYYNKGNAPASGEIQLAADFYGTSASFYSYQIDGSLRFNASDSAYLSRTPSAGNRQTWTWSAWAKLGNFDNWPQSTAYIFSVATGADNTSHFYLHQRDTGQLRISGYSVNWRETTARYRDHSAWYHIVLACDSTQATAQNRIRLYINGEEVTAWDINNAPSQNQNFAINMAAEHRINQHPPGYNYPWGGYMAEINFVDGSQLAPTSFGQTVEGVWIPKDYTGSYGTNGFHLEFAGNANDSSGNSNNWTANNIAASDYLLDSPTNNFATLSVLAQDRYSSRATLAEGNLRATGTDKWGQSNFRIPSSGKWYFEMRAQTSSTSNRDGFGITDVMGMGSASAPYYSIYRSNAKKTTSGGEVSYGASWTSGDVLGCAVDATAGSVVFYKNGTSQGTAYTGLDFEADVYFPTVYPRSISNSANLVANFGQDSTFAGALSAGGNQDANGRGDFRYSVPSGYLALCSENLTIAEGIDPNAANSPTDHFSVKLYPGNGGTQSITGVGFEPSITWIKSRNHGHNPELYQAVEGATKMWMTSYNNSDTTRSNGLTSFNSDGFSLGSSVYTNQNGLNFVAWNWKANGAGSSNTTGSITATVSANADAGISIIKWTGTGASGTLGHGLNSAPKFLINKAFHGSNSGWTAYWNIWGNGMDITKRVFFSSDAQADAQGGWGNTEPTDSVIYLGSKDELNGSNGNFSMLAFAPVEGFSAFSSYIGNGSTDGPFIYTGFRVAYVLVKKITAAENWSTADTTRSPFNVSQNGLQPGTANSENTTSGFAIDFLSNGFKPRSGAGQWNDTGATYIYAAFAENPFKYANAR